MDLIRLILGFFRAVTLMVMVTALIAPPLVGRLLAANPHKGRVQPGQGINGLVNDA